jgi:PAS domain S-box-containing protein
MKSDAINLLLVDDEPANLLVLKALMADLNVHLVTAGSGEEALKQVLLTDFAVILLDVLMPTMSGFDTARLVRSRPQSSHTPIIFITAAPDAPGFAIEDAYALGAVDYLLKPVNPVILRAKVNVFIDLHRKTQDLARMERERNVAVLNAANQRMRLILDNSKDFAFIVTDQDGRITEWEGGAELITGWRQNEVIGQSFSIIFTPDDKALSIPEAELARAREIGRAEDKRWHLRKDGSRFFADGVLVRLDDDSGLLHGFTKIFRDATLVRQAEHDLRKLADDLSQANQKKTEFLATLAHELRNPLAPIRNGLEVMRLAADNPLVSERARETMERQVNHMVHLVDDLLDVARITSGNIELKKTYVDLKTIVTNAVETSLPVIEAGQHKLTVSLQEAPAFLDADPVRLCQVFSNLLTNAAKYTPDGGQIVLSAETDGSDAVISVTDNGIGIPLEALPLVFDMFTQVKRNSGHAKGGLGIGLSLVRRLIEMHSGTVSVYSQGIDQGSTFCIRLPLATDVGSKTLFANLETKELSIAGSKHLRLLVVDDNTDAAETLAALLEIAGHSTGVASSGYQAIELATQLRPDVIFLDIGMPGMNGYDVAKVLRSTCGLEDVFLIALTGWGTEKDRRLTKEAGFNEHLTKPASIVKVNAILSKLAEAAKPFHADKV